MSCKVGNQTNSQDPQAVNSRVFVGNLNTFQCSKTDVERIFQRYGRIAGISMHKGYAFIQFTNPFDARSACLGEDARLLWGQTLDVNMVAEPKSHQTGRKRANIAKAGQTDWDYYYDSLKVQLESLYRSYYAQVGLPGPRLVPPMKRPRIHGPAATRPTVKAPSPKSHPNNTSAASLTDLKTYSTPDILICGNCREHFNEVEQLIEHKKTYCKLRFTCKCHLLNGSKLKGEEPAALLCSQCKDSFSSAWDLMVHVQAAHMLNIYQLSSDSSSGNSSRDQSESRELKHMSVNNCMDGIPNGLNPNGTLMGDSLMEDSHCQTDLSSSTSSSSSSTILTNHHYHHRIEDSSTMTDVSTSTGMENMPMSHSACVGGGIPSASGMHGDNNGPPPTSTQSSSTMTNFLTDGHGGTGGGGGVQHHQYQVPLVNGNGGGGGGGVGDGGGLCSQSQCSTSVNHSPNGGFHGGHTFLQSSSGTPSSSLSTTSSSSSSTYDSAILPSQPMEASTQTQCLQVDDSLLHPENNNGPAATITNNNQVVTTSVASGVVGVSGGIPSNFDEHCSIVSTLKQEGNMHLPFSNGQVASM